LLAEDLTDVPVTNNAYRLKVDGQTYLNNYPGTAFDGYSLQQSVVALQTVLNKMGLMGQELKNQDLQTRTYYKESLTAAYNDNAETYGPTATAETFAQVFGEKTLP
jgi:hypothetical protein